MCRDQKNIDGSRDPIRKPGHSGKTDPYKKRFQALRGALSLLLPSTWAGIGGPY